MNDIEFVEALMKENSKALSFISANAIMKTHDEDRIFVYSALKVLTPFFPPDSMSKSESIDLKPKNLRYTSIKWEFNWRLQSKLKDIQSISFYEQLPGPFTESYLVGLTPSKYDMFL